MRRRRNFTGIYIVMALVIAFLAGQFWYLSRSFTSDGATPDDPTSGSTSTAETAPDAIAPPLFSEHYERAAEIMREMSLETKVSQLFLVRFPEADALATIAAAEPGGFILFAKDFQYETPASIRAKLQALQDVASTNFLLAVDEEGGIVTRVSRYPAFRSTRFASPQELYQRGGLDLIVQDSHEKSALLTSLGLNMNLAPVADVSTTSTSFIYSRTLGQDATETARYVSAVAAAMQSDGMISALKHFPGYGDNADTHTGVAIDPRSYDQLAAADLLPFISGIATGAPTILVSHNVLTAIDPSLPASLSPAVVDILRRNLGFTGVIVTDDLAMAAVQAYDMDSTVATLAVLAGDDLLITSDFFTERQGVLKAVAEGVIDESRLDASVQRLLAMKLAYGVIK